LGEPVAASCAMIMSNLQKFVPSCRLAVLSHHTPRFFLYVVSLYCGHLPFFYRILFLISLHSGHAAAVARALTNHAFSRAQVGILVHISPTHGTSNGNEDPSSMLTTATIVARGQTKGECDPQRFSPGNNLPTASASLRRFSPFSRDGWSRQLAP
jgi:hypothetical protein